MIKETPRLLDVVQDIPKATGKRKHRTLVRKEPVYLTKLVDKIGTRAKVAEMLGVTPTAVNTWLREDAARPSAEMWAELYWRDNYEPKQKRYVVSIPVKQSQIEKVSAALEHVGIKNATLLEVK